MGVEATPNSEAVVETDAGAFSPARTTFVGPLQRIPGLQRVAERAEPLPRHLARDALRRRMLAAADGLAVLLASLLSAWNAPTLDQLFWMVAILPVWLILAKLQGLYDRDHRALRHLTADELGAIFTWGSVGTAGAVGLLALTPSGAPEAPAALRLWLGVTVFAAILRGAARLLWRAWTPPATALLVGSGPLERATRRKLELFGDIHVEVTGALDDEALAAAPGDDALDARVRGACGGTLPDRVVVCTQDVHEELLADVMRFCRRRRIKLSVVPPLRGMFGTAVRLTHVAELPFVEYHTWDTSQSTLTLKRCFDVGVALLGLLLTAPILVAAAVAIRLDSRGSVFYVQRRAGLEGRPFRMLKFRTMVADADARRTDLVSLDSLTDPMYKLRGDPRVTRVGRVLRRWSLDELPQLVNVLRGEMSIVGPRPEELALVERYRPEHRFRLGVTPGMTGPMQVFGRGDLEFEERLAIEREYLENLSLGRDLRIVLLTLPAVVSGR
ncbi:MAG TPA: exopolysaccharide biosynthesis polyprenyl glycosylphosphotransferase, partial [Solirubrobacteraceae bacterium]|nr:exopolysaccharide biosynthesis polyprenyl glycosylphosphotransferase [Solirubrobacteraceae bacterium]